MAPVIIFKAYMAWAINFLPDEMRHEKIFNFFLFFMKIFSC